MFSEIVVPLDGSDLSATALPVGYKMAAASKAKLLVFGFASKASELQSLQIRVEDQVAVTGALTPEAASVEVNVVCRLTDTPVQDELGAAIAECDRPLLCMSSHGRGRSEALTGSVASEMLKRIETPVLLVGPACETNRFDPNGSLLVAVDSSETSERVIPAAIWWARKFDSALEFVTVLQPQGAMAPPAPGWATVSAGTANESIQVERLARAAEQQIGRDVNFEVLHGSKPAASLLEWAKSSEADLIAMATHGATGLDRVLSGSVTSDVLRHSSCPLIVMGPAS